MINLNEIKFLIFCMSFKIAKFVQPKIQYPNENLDIPMHKVECVVKLLKTEQSVIRESDTRGKGQSAVFEHVLYRH